MLGLKVHNVLSDIMNEAFPNNVFSKFFIEMIPKEYATIHGRYYYKSRKIEIFNLSREPKRILITTIHELAHHVDRNIRGKSGHDKHFYQVHRMLLITAVEMGIVSLRDIAIINDSLDAEKLEAYFGEIMSWKYTPKSYKTNKSMIKVQFSFSIKDILRGRGYKYSKDEKLWEKEIEQCVLKEEVNYLKTIINEKNIIIKKASDVDFQIIYELTAHTLPTNFSVLEKLKYKPMDNGGAYRKYIKSTELNNEIAIFRTSGIKNIKLKVSGKQAYSN